MPNDPNYFAPLPKSTLNRDGDKLWLREQSISAQKLITGTLQTSEGITLGGDLLSDNWDGDNPANLATIDTGATEGFYIDGSAGAAQFISGVFVGVSGRHIELDPASWAAGVVEVSLVTGNGEAAKLQVTIGAIGMSSTNTVVLEAQPIEDINTLVLRGPDGIHLQEGPSFFEDGSASAPALSFPSDTDTGIYRSTTDEVSVATGGSTSFRVSNGNVAGTFTNTTGNAANLNQGGTVGSLNSIRRSTSALKYKTELTDADHLADIELKPMKFYREDDGRYFYGFIADWLGDQDPILGEYEKGEIENYDQRAVMAVMAAKINRLEGAVYG